MPSLAMHVHVGKAVFPTAPLAHQAISTAGGGPGWIATNVNQAHLDYFFWTLLVLMVRGVRGSAANSTEEGPRTFRDALPPKPKVALLPKRTRPHAGLPPASLPPCRLPPCPCPHPTLPPCLLPPRSS